MNKLNEKLLKFAGFKRCDCDKCSKGGTFYPNSFYVYPDSSAHQPPDFRDLNECFDWLVTTYICGVAFRYYPGGVTCVITVIDEGGFTEYESWVKAESEADSRKKNAQALCRAIEKYIDAEKGNDRRKS